MRRFFTRRSGLDYSRVIRRTIMLQFGRNVRTLALASTLAGALVIWGCNDDDDDLTNPVEQDFTVNMTGGSERPDPVTTEATGTAELSFTGTGPIAYTITVAGLSGAATAAHIHGPADASETADPIVTFTDLSSAPSGQLVSGSITSTDVATISLDSLKVLLRNGKAYINVHTAANPNGEIRGQVVAQQ